MTEWRLWNLARRVELLLRREVALTDDQLADRTGASEKDIRTVVAILINQRRIDRCGSYLVLVAPKDRA
jgi:hypothetical protein